jgi:hypothetical protein
MELAASRPVRSGIIARLGTLAIMFLLGAGVRPSDDVSLEPGADREVGSPERRLRDARIRRRAT